jgi:hypothetical protein
MLKRLENFVEGAWRPSCAVADPADDEARAAMLLV